MSAFSYQDCVTCSGEKEISAALFSCAICSARAAAPGCSSASASVNSSQGLLASFAARKTALFFPTQPAGTSCVSSNRRCGILVIKLRTISAVLSVDWSFTTIISGISRCSTSDSMHAAMTASSFRAGTMAVIDGGREAEGGAEFGDYLVTVKSGGKDRFSIPSGEARIAFDEKRL